MSFGEKIASQLSCSQSYVANKLRLLRIPEEERDEILAASLTERHVRALLRIKDSAQRRSVLHAIIRRDMNVAATEEYVDRIVASAKEAEQGTAKSGGSTRLIIRDVRLFYNTIDRAVETVRTSGIPVETCRRETGIQIPMGLLREGIT